MKNEPKERFYALRYRPNWIEKTQFIISLIIGLPLVIIALIPLAMIAYALYIDYHKEIEACLASN